MRGFLWEGARLTKALLDDVEDPEGVLTPLRRFRLLDWVQGDVAKLGNASFNLDLIGTILHPASALATLLKNPGFQASHYQAVLHFAEGDEAWNLWTEWRVIVTNLEDTARLVHAHQFYLDHEAVMLTAVEVLWPEEQSYEYLMLDRVIYGETAFWTERQNTPLHDQRYVFDMDQVARCTVQPGGILRADRTFIPWLDIPDVAAYHDPTADKQAVVGSDYACCVVMARDTHGYLYVLGVYCAQEASTRQQLLDVVDLLWEWQVPLFGLEANGFQSLLAGTLRELIAQRAKDEGVTWDVTLVPIVNTRNKILRIQTLEPLLANHWLQLAVNVPADYLRQFRDFLPIEGSGGHDDAPDATEGAARVVQGLYDRRSF